MRVKTGRFGAVRLHHAQALAVQAVIVRLGGRQVVGWFVIAPGANPVSHFHRHLPVDVYQFSRNRQKLLDGEDHLVCFLPFNAAGNPANHSFDRMDELTACKGDQVGADLANLQCHLCQ